MARKSELIKASDGAGNAITPIKEKAFERKQSIATGCNKYKSGSIQKFTSKSCRLFLSYKDNATGKWKTKTKTYRPETGKKLTQTDAKNALLLWAKELEQVEAEQAANRSKNTSQTVAQYIQHYIDGRQKIEPRTRSEYEAVLRLRIAPYLGNYPIDELNPEIIQSWVNELAKTHKPRTVRKAFVVLRAAMRQAVLRETLAKDPTLTVETPEIPHTNPNALDKASAAQVLQFIAIDPSSAANMGYALALLLGMRQGEICGLTWRYVDLKKKTIRVVQALGHDNNARGVDRWYMKEPKNEGSRRTLTIPDQLIEPLTERLQHAKEAAFANNRAKWQDYYVIGGDDGSPMNGEMLGTRWSHTAKALNLVGTEGVRPTFHDLRHSYATIAISEGTDIKTVSSLLGHKNAAMTLNIYASADPKAKQQAAQNVANAMFAEVDKHKHDGEVITLDKTGTDN